MRVEVWSHGGVVRGIVVHALPHILVLGEVPDPARYPGARRPGDEQAEDARRLWQKLTAQVASTRPEAVEDGGPGGPVGLRLMGTLVSAPRWTREVYELTPSLDTLAVLRRLTAG